ncbi:Ig-like domain-containing protein [Geothrix limicola]|uniref:Ig-like domain-containing protein n=1 Tax=Geothrix limicola TaxID=2927978 RepID=UPI003B75B89F
MRIPLIPVLLLGLLACTGHRGNSASAPVYDALQISPSQTTVKVSSTQQFQIIGLAPQPVENYNWTTDQGTITPQGLYTAPSSPGSARVTATSKTTSSEIHIASITVAP